MKTRHLSLPAAVVVLALQGCGREAPQTVVEPPRASLPDNAVLQGAGQQAAAPATAASAPVASASVGAAPQVAGNTPPDAGSATVAPGMEPAPPQAGAMGAAPAASAPAAPVAAPEAAPGGQGSAAMTEMWREFPPGGATGASAPASAPTASNAASQPAAASPSSAASAPQNVSAAGLPAVRDPGDAQGAQMLAQRALAVPVVGIQPTALSDNYEQSRGSRTHEAIDILAPAGTPVVAVDDGRIAKLFTSKPGGLTVYQFDPTAHLAYYYAHLQRYADGVREGMAVQRGTLIGYVGSSGNANPATPHLHFAVFRLGTPPQWWQGAPVNPYPALSRAQPVQQVASR